MDCAGRAVYRMDCAGRALSALPYSVSYHTTSQTTHLLRTRDTCGRVRTHLPLPWGTAVCFLTVSPTKLRYDAPLYRSQMHPI
jgi:hypothetical protein